MTPESQKQANLDDQSIVERLRTDDDLDIEIPVMMFTPRIPDLDETD